MGFVFWKRSPFYCLLPLLSIPFATCSPSPIRDARTVCPDGQNFASNSACCPLFPILEDIQKNLFEGTCGSAARKALRVAFHDAIGYSPSEGGGGADGSIITFSTTELTYPSSAGLDAMVALEKGYVEKYASSISAGDFVQFAAAVGLTNCPGAPRLEFLLGRPKATEAAPSTLVPSPADNATTILARMADAGFSPEEVVALLASHSIAAADNIDATIPGTPLDSTPSQFDAQFYIEVLLRGTGYPGTGRSTSEVSSPLPGELRLQSDYVLSRDPRTSCSWQAFATNPSLTQQAFKAAMAKLSIVAQDASDFIDCSDVIPEPEQPDDSPHFPAGKSSKDLQQTCPVPFPSLPTEPGPETSVSPVAVDP